MEDLYEDLAPITFSEAERRCAAVMCLVNNSGDITNREIQNATGITMKTIQRTRKTLEETKDPRGTIERKERPEKSTRRKRSNEFIDQVQDIVEGDPSRSIRSIADELEVAPNTVKSCLNDDLHYKSYRMQMGQILTPATKNRRILKCVKLLNKLKHPMEQNMLWFFSDEKNFCQDQAHNSQNNRWLATCTKDVPKVMKTKFPATVMVFGVVSNEGHVMPPHIFEVGLRVNTDIYLDVLESVVFPWIRRIAGNRPWVWQQDSAPCHVSHRAMAWIEEHAYDCVTKDMWPPSSPDLNPMDYFVWGYLESRVNRRPHTTKASLIASIKEQFASMPSTLVKRACGRFRTRITAVIEAEGNYIERS